MAKKTGLKIMYDGKNVADLTREKLEVIALKVRDELIKERKQINFFENDRDRVQTYWEIEKSNIAEAKNILKHREVQIEEENEKTELAIRRVKEKVKFLEYEHAARVKNFKEFIENKSKLARETHEEKKDEMLNVKKELKKKLILKNAENTEELQAKLNDEIEKMKVYYQQLINNTAIQFKKSYDTMKTEVIEKNFVELCQVKENSNQELEHGVANFNINFAEIQSYYNEVVGNTLSVIHSLKVYKNQILKQNEDMLTQMAVLAQENEQIIEPRKIATARLKEIRRLLLFYEKDKIIAPFFEKKLKQTESKLEHLISDYDILNANLMELEKENEFETMLKPAMKRSTIFRRTLATKLYELQNQYEQQQKALNSIKISAPKLTKAIEKKVKTIIKCKNMKIELLQFDITKAIQSHDDALKIYEAKLAKLGIPITELGFKVLRKNTRSKVAQML